MASNTVWTNEEVKFLKENYTEHGVNYVAENLNKTVSSVRNKARRVGVQMPPPWDDEKDSALKDIYPQYGASPLMGKLNKTRGAIIARAMDLGVVYVGYVWTDEQKKFLEENYAKHGAKYVAEHIGKSYASVKKYASDNDICRMKELVWSDDELDILKKYYPVHGAAYVANLLPKRSVTAVNIKASKEKIAQDSYFWNDDEEEFLRNNYGYINTYKIAKKLDKTYQSIISKASDMGLTTCREWTQDEDEWLINNMNDMTLDKIYKHLNRNKFNVQRRIKELGYERDYYDEGYYSATDVADIAGVSLTSILYRLKKGNQKINKIKFKNQNRYRFTPADIIRFLHANLDMWQDDLSRVDKDTINILCLDDKVRGNCYREANYIKSLFNDTYWRRVSDTKNNSGYVDSLTDRIS